MDKHKHSLSLSSRIELSDELKAYRTYKRAREPIRHPEKGEIERIIARNVRWVSLDELKEIYPEPIRYPEEVKMNGIAAQLRREMAKGKVIGHFC